jgi:hypothetical protein
LLSKSAGKSLKVFCNLIAFENTNGYSLVALGHPWKEAIVNPNANFAKFARGLPILEQAHYRLLTTLWKFK